MRPGGFSPAGRGACIAFHRDQLRPPGTGDSGDTSPYAVEREVEDLGALIAEAGGTASLYGHSSGLVLHEPPYVPDREEERWISPEFAGRLEPILAQGRRGEAVELLWTTMGMPLEMVEAMRDEPSWAEMEAMAPKTAYDSEVMGDMSRGGTVPTDLVGTVPALVLCGGASPGWMIDTATRIADAMPNGRLGLLEGEEHVVAPELLAPVLAAFLAD